MNVSSNWRRLTSVERVLLISAFLWAVLLLVGMGLGVELESWKAQKVLDLLFWLSPFALLILALNVRRSLWRWFAIVATGLLMVVAVQTNFSTGAMRESYAPIERACKAIGK